MIDSFTSGKAPNTMIANSHAFQRFMLMDSPYFQNSEAFAQTFVKDDGDALKRVMLDHVTSDWRDVLRKRIDVPTAIFTGVHGDSLAGQRWIHSVIPNSELHVYTAEEQGDHFLMFKNPLTFTAELDAFLKKPH